MANFFLGTDSAPHPRSEKESACGCAGCFTAHAALELYAEAFDRAGALERLEAFASFNGPDFYRLPRNARVLDVLSNDDNTREATLALNGALVVNRFTPARFPFTVQALVSGFVPFQHQHQ